MINRQNIMKGFKQDITVLLTRIFGDCINSIISENYDDDNPKELYSLADSMLSRFIGEKNSKKKLSAILKKYPKIKVN